MILIGIDPGLSGALAAVEAAGEGRPRFIDVIDIPTIGEKAKQRVDVLGVMDWIRSVKADHAAIERAQAMPDQGASSGFKYGRAVGALETCVIGLLIPHTIVEASSWKRALGLIGQDKEGSRQRAIALFPEARDKLARKLDHNRAESILIARFGLMLHRGGVALSPELVSGES